MEQTFSLSDLIPCRDERISHLKRNWFFPISAAAFFCTLVKSHLMSVLGVAVAILLSPAVAACCPPLLPFIKKQPNRIKILSRFNVLGMCLFSLENSLLHQFEASILCGGSAGAVLDLLHCSEDFLVGFLRVFVWFITVLSIPALYIFFLAFWSYMETLFRRFDLRSCGEKSTLIPCLLFFFAEAALVLYVYSSGEQVYRAQVYSSDGIFLYEPSAFLCIPQPENDLRQPLFALFAMPFASFLYPLRCLFPTVEWLWSVATILPQLFLLALASALFVRTLDLERTDRVAFLLLILVSYPLFFNGFLIEQYMISYFYLVLALCAVIRGFDSPFFLCGAGGTLLSGVVLAPFFSRHNPLREFRPWFLDMLRYAVVFLGVLLAFTRGDILFSAFSQWSSLSRFAGGSSFSYRLMQYTHFVSSCLVAPADIMTASFFYMKLGDFDTPHLLGILILLLGAAGFWVSRREKSSQLALAWIALSFFLCVVLGWGSTENIQPLYSLYFFWAFLLLIFRFLQFVFKKCTSGVKALGYAVCILPVFFLNVSRAGTYIDFLLSFHAN